MNSQSSAVLEYVEKVRICRTSDLIPLAPERSLHRILTQLEEDGKITRNLGRILAQGELQEDFISLAEASRITTLDIKLLRSLWQQFGNQRNTDNPSSFRRTLRKTDVVDFMNRFRIGPAIKTLPNCVKRESLKEYGLHSWTIKKFWMPQGLPYFKIGSSIILDRAEVRDFLRHRYQGSKPKHCTNRWADLIRQRSGLLAAA